ncbi:MAG: hypothetical protein CMJ83_12330 [Planctomycetes bacterium]|nr:hypothetical protein [Planctomycetota bacterium]
MATPGASYGSVWAGRVDTPSDRHRMTIRRGEPGFRRRRTSMSGAAPESNQVASPESDAIPPVTLPALILPVVTGIVLWLMIFLFESHDAAFEVLVKGLVTGVLAGKFGVLLPDKDGFLSTPYHMAVLIVYLDLTFGFISVFNVGVLFRIPGFGKKLQNLAGFGQLMLRRNPWMRKATFAGTVAFVMFPFSGTGAIGGALFGQLLGMTRRRTMLAIFVGAVIGSFGLASLANLLPAGLADSPVFKIGGLVFIIVLVGWLTKLYKSMDPGDDGEAPGGAGEDATSGS